MSRKLDIDELLAEVNEIKIKLKKEYEQAKNEPVSTQVSKIMVKSALEHLRSILDYATLDIHEEYYNGNGKIYFPFGKDKALFKKNLKKHFKNLTKKAPKIYEIIKSIQPFETKKNWLITLCKVVNNNKHNKLSSQKIHKQQSVTIGNIIKVSGNSTVTINNCTVNGIPISKYPNTPIIISDKFTEEELKKNLNPFLSLNLEIDKVKFFLDKTGCDALELITEAINGIESMINKLYLEISANKAN